jgi:hypothetical protein
MNDCVCAELEIAQGEIKRLRAEGERQKGALRAAAAVIGSIYQHLERVENAGGATSLSGIAACNTMLKSLRKNASRVETLVMEPARAALGEEKK